MTLTERHKRMEALFRQCLVIAQKKGMDYGQELDAFSNLRLAADLGICPMQDGILVRITDKISRIANLLNRPARVKDESLIDSVRDAINYLAFIAILVEDKRVEETVEKELPKMNEDPSYPCNNVKTWIKKRTPPGFLGGQVCRDPNVDVKETTKAPAEIPPLPMLGISNMPISPTVSENPYNDIRQDFKP